jgi:aspartate aminotransferase, mitochondrial
LYGERAGAFAVHCASKEEKTRVLSQLKIISRVMISSPPIHAAHLVIEILSDSHLKQQWFQETKLMADRIKSMSIRLSTPFLTHLGSQLKDGLKKAGSKRDWSHITSQIGIFPSFIDSR